MPHADFWATEPHFIDHLAPLWHALDPERRGTFWTTPALVGHAATLGVEAKAADGIPRALRSGRWPIVTAAWGQAGKALSTRRPVVLLNHGSGQTFTGVSHPSYSGGAPELRRRIALFLEPGPHAAEATLASIPEARVVQVGPAKLDTWHTSPPKPAGERPVAAISFHWRCKVVAEAGTAFDYYRSALADLAAGPWELLGHGHPTLWNEIRPIYEELGIEPVRRFDDVLARADLYIADGTSTLYEFASTGRPVLCLNTPAYRRDVHHGLRFWDAVPGLECDHPADLRSKVVEALEDPVEARVRRAHGVARAYVACDGQAAVRAAEAISVLIDEAAVETVAVSSPLGTVNVSRRIWELLADGVEIVDGRGFRMLVRHTDYRDRWGPSGWRIANDDDD